MLRIVGIVLSIFVLIFENHAYPFVQTDSATSLGGAPVGLVSRIGWNGDSELLTSLGNAKVGSYHRQRYPIARFPIALPYAVPYGLRLIRRPIPIKTVGKVGLPGPKPGGISGRCRGGGCGGGEVVTNQNQLLGIDIGGLLGGIFQGGGAGGNVSPGLLGGLLGGGGLLG